jgi:enoyl-CoA hydratase/carnithine racemase
MEWGMVNKICPQASLLAEVIACASSILGNAHSSVKSIKSTLMRSYGVPLSEGLNIESDLYNSLLHTSDRTEGLNAFNQKRRPIFTGS